MWPNLQMTKEKKTEYESDTAQNLSQLIITCSKLTIQTLEQRVKYI